MKNTSRKITCLLSGHKFKYPTDLVWGYLTDKCTRCGKRYWDKREFDFWGGAKEFWLSNKNSIVFRDKSYWERICLEFPELKEEDK